MNEVIEKEKIVVESMIYEIKGKQVMLDTEISITECHDYCDNMITHYNIGVPISVCNKIYERK